MTVYFISGLGADERAFQRIRLPAGFEIRHIPWLPVKGDETIEGYARQMAAAIEPGKPFMLAGLSFGGMMATEISKFLKPEKLILFSTVKCRQELPSIYLRAGRLGLYRFLRKTRIPLSLPFLHWFFGPLDAESRRLIDSFRDQIEPGYLRWSLKQISCWQNRDIFNPHVQIHGERDRAFPKSLVKANYVIGKAGHLCVFSHAEEVNRILRKELSVQFSC